MNLVCCQVEEWVQLRGLVGILVSWRFVELEFIALTIVEGRDTSPLVFRNSRWKLDALPLEIVNRILQANIQVKGYHRSTTGLCALRLPTIKPDVESIGVDFGPWAVLLDKTET